MLARGKTQVATAAALGVTDRTIRNWAKAKSFQSALIGEAIELRWGDVEGGWLRVNRRYYRGRVALPKGRKRRSVPLSRELAQALWALRKERHAADEELVWVSHAGLRVDQSNVMSRVLKPAARKAGIGD